MPAALAVCSNNKIKSVLFRRGKLFRKRDIHNAIKAPHRYDVQGSDTTMMTRATSLPGQKIL